MKLNIVTIFMFLLFMIPITLGHSFIGKTGKTSIKPIDFNVIFNQSTNGLSVKTSYSKHAIDLKLSFEDTSLLKTYPSLSDINLPLEKLSNSMYKYNITIPVIPKGMEYLILEIVSDLKVENNSFDNSIGLFGEDFAIIFDFYDLKGFDYVIEGNKVKIDISSMSSIHIDPTITFTTERVESVAITPLSDDSFVLAWCDDVADDVEFIIYDTDGTIKVSQVSVDENVGSCDYTSVSVATLNSTHFVIAWDDESENDATFSIYDTTGTLITGPIDADTSIGANSFGISVSAFNETDFVFGWYDNAADDVIFSVYDIDGNLKTGPIIVDSNSGASSYSATVITLNETYFIFGWADTIDFDAHFVVYDIDGNIKVSEVIPDNDISYGRRVSMSPFDEDRFVFAWPDVTDQDMTVAIYYTNGTLIVGPIDVDTTAGGSSHSIEVSVLNSTHLVVGWFNDTSNDNLFAIYDSSLNLVVGPINSATSGGERWQTVTSQLTTLDIGICDQNFIHAFVVTSSVANWTSYMPNGTIWDGICPDTISPTYSDNSTNSTLAGNPILHSLKWTDETGLAITGGYIFSFDNCTGSLVNDSWVAFSSNPEWSNVTKIINSTTGCTIRWCIYANDTSNNWNGISCDDPFSYITTSLPPPPPPPEFCTYKKKLVFNNLNVFDWFLSWLFGKKRHPFFDYVNECDPDENIVIERIDITSNTTSLVCNSTLEGSIFYSNNTKKHYGCNSTDWNGLYGG